MEERDGKREKGREEDEQQQIPSQNSCAVLFSVAELLVIGPSICYSYGADKNNVEIFVNRFNLCIIVGSS